MPKKEIVIVRSDGVKITLKYNGIAYEITEGPSLKMAGQSRPCACLAVKQALEGVIKELKLDDFLKVKFMGIY